MKAKNLGIFSAVFASICCVGPFLLALIGLGGLGAGALIGKYHWWFLGGSILLISIAWRYYFKEKKVCVLKACEMKNQKATQTMLVVASIVIVSFVLLNLYSLCKQFDLGAAIGCCIR